MIIFVKDNRQTNHLMLNFTYRGDFMIKLVNFAGQCEPCILTEIQQRGAQNWLYEYPSGITARYFEERFKSCFDRCKNEL